MSEKDGGYSDSMDHDNGIVSVNVIAVLNKNWSYKTVQIIRWSFIKNEVFWWKYLTAFDNEVYMTGTSLERLNIIQN